jgi:hypothetical protein
MNLYTPTEAQEQTAVFNWAAVMVRRWPELRLMYHVPNGGSRNPKEARNLKQQGVKPGIPDICLPVARKGYHGLYIEMKRRKGGKISAEQAQMLGDLREQGYCAWVCKGANDAIELITEYLSDGNNTTMPGML